MDRNEKIAIRRKADGAIERLEAELIHRITNDDFHIADLYRVFYAAFGIEDEDVKIMKNYLDVSDVSPGNWGGNLKINELKELIDQIDEKKKIVAKQRDEMRELYNELVNGTHDIRNAIDTLSEFV